MRKFEELLEEHLADEKVKKEYEELEVEYSITSAIIAARKERKMTQKELSQKTGIDRADISKIETGYSNPTIQQLQKLALGMGMKMVVNFVPIKR